MTEPRDLSRLLRQHRELESFFAGDFTLRSRPVSADACEAKDSRRLLEAIAEEVRACRKCQIGSTRLNAVPGEGNPKARLVFVGEAPGADEDQQGRPFVGRAGQLLTRMIAAIGLRREDVFICNTLKCRPPENRDPRPDEIWNCLPYLKRQLAILRPEVIVALGSHAARTLLETDTAIGKLRGHFHEYRFSDADRPAKVMPTYHPAYLLRNYSYENRQRVWEDLQKVADALGLQLPQGGRQAGPS
ncbi:MAG TPA: uracil-DNA glycosylase [Anaerohalosphaeraceae bacterium]|nr:uracil-DNA glycosylase [Anaerohalosphaeraceae bacterium]